MQKDTCVAAVVVYPDPLSEKNARLLIESLRTFGGSLSNTPVLCLTPNIDRDVSPSFLDLCRSHAVNVASYDIPADAIHFPLAAYVAGAACAEEKARGQAECLAWLGANTIIFHEPRDFLIPRGTCIGYRPVHHTNIGSAMDDALDPFWSDVYSACKVPSDSVFPMKTHVDGKTLRPYFNAGSLVIRPERGLFVAWRDMFFKTFQQPQFKTHYEQDNRYAIFMHQAILSGVILAGIGSKEMIKLPPTYNYPLHLWQEDVTNARPHRLDELVTGRHEGFYQDPEWRTAMPEGDDLKDWLAEHAR